MKERKPRKNGIYSINVSFCENEAHLLNYADTHGSFTSYVKRLIREDMEKINTTSTLETLLGNSNFLKMLLESKEKGISSDIDKYPKEMKEENEVDIDAIQDLLNI